ncbi:MAG TPA: 4a-hydroxytetrahydrobiopterin dehydratase [bacterium]|nr:4a-hydroxytetrahydrobiopterin dehydratase [bacterium]
MAKLLSGNEIAEYLKKTETWTLLEGKQAIHRTYILKNFTAALDFVNRVGAEAEGMDHHPDIFLHDYKNVTLTLSTHDAGGLTRMDFDLAAKIENAFQQLQNLTVPK